MDQRHNEITEKVGNLVLVRRKITIIYMDRGTENLYYATLDFLFVTCNDNNSIGFFNATFLFKKNKLLMTQKKTTTTKLLLFQIENRTWST